MNDMLALAGTRRLRITTAVLLALGAFCVVLIGGFLVVYLATQQNLVAVAARSLFVSREQTVAARLDELFGAPKIAAVGLAASASHNVGGVTAEENALLTLHESLPQIVNIKIGTPDGLYFTTSRISMTPDTRYYTPPPSATTAIVTIRPNADGTFTQRVHFRGVDGAAIGDVLESASTTDVRKLDWYVAGRASIGSATLLSGSVPGRVGPRMSFVSGMDSGEAGAVAVDVGHTEVSDALVAVAQSSDEHLVVFDSDGLCFGTTEPEAADGDSREGAPPRLCQSQLNQDLFEAFKKESAFSGQTLTLAQRQYYVSVMPVEFRGLASGTQIFMAMATPLDIIEQPFRQNLLLTLGVTVATMLFAVPVLLFYARKFAQPIHNLRTTIDSTLELNFGAKSVSHSVIVEIHSLIEKFRQVRDAFQNICRFVPEAHVKRIVSTGSAQVFGERRLVSLLMTDVSDFVAISETLPPERLLGDMTEYFTALTREILARDGTVDKYVGDAIFSYWNGVTDQPTHAEICCRAGLRVVRASKELAAKWQAAGKRPWHTRVGLHSGEVVVGNIGSEQRIDFTVIGGSVNLASRVEGLNKYYGTEILATDQIRRRCGKKFVFRTIDIALPKGTTDAIDLHELIGCRDEPDLAPDAETMAYVEAWESAIALYRKREFGAAANAFERLMARRPGDLVARMYVARSHALHADPPGVDWDNVERFNSK